MITAVIIDDEAKGRITLQKMLEDFCPDVEILDTAHDVLSGVKIISKHHPDVVFLDIEMPNYSGFKLIEYFDDIDFEVIFTTAYSEHAIKAFKVSAIAYLLKPIDIEDLQKAVAKVKELKPLKKNDHRLQNMQDSLAQKKISRVVLPVQEGWIYAKFKEIKYFESDGRNTFVYLLDGTKELTTYSLKKCEEVLKGTSFIRVHRSFIVNLQFIKQYAKGRDSYVEMENDVRIDVGKNYKDDLNAVVSYFVK